ncbi:MAG: hypothetical protein B7Z73_01610 [Planctomycetia bacterium 21-64-5]|nr:MAG: hypothetical protein B7Z73_01610 [Planctomycetia bacterium 21-64-5]
MIKRQWRLERIVRIAQEYLAADTAAELLAAELKAHPNYGEARGWSARAGGDVVENLPATYVVRIYAEFEAGLRDYWQTHLGQASHPPMVQLVRHLIPNQRFRKIASTMPMKCASFGTFWSTISSMNLLRIWSRSPFSRRKSTCAITSRGWTRPGSEC